MEDILSSDFVHEKELLSPYDHIIQVQGKRLRVKIILAFNYWLKVPMETVNHILNILNIGHNAGLLFDDIQDNSIVRRGLPAAHCIYGVPLTMNASLQLFFLTIRKIVNLKSEAQKIYLDEMLNVIRGQGQEIYWRDNYLCPTEAEYKEMVKRKTSSSYKLSIRIIQLYSEDNRDYSDLILMLGLYFQIRDDYCNLDRQEALEEWPSTDDKEAQEESFCEDLTEGKFTLPIIHALKTPQGEEVQNILRQKTRDVALKKHCISLLDKAGSLQYTRDTLWALDKEIRQELCRFGGNPELEAVLHELLTWQDQGEVEAS